MSVMASSRPDLRDMQGLGVAGFHKDTHQVLAIRFGSPDASAGLLAYLARRCASAQEVLAFNEAFSSSRDRSGERVVEAAWVGAAISARGYDALGVDTRTMGSGDSVDAFRAGMAARATHVGDTANDAPQRWLPEFQPEHGVDALMLVTADSADRLDHACAALEAELARSDCLCVFRERGGRLSGGQEPKHLEWWEDLRGQATLHIAPPLGSDGLPWIPTEAFALAGGTRDQWCNGSFLVFRRLVQHDMARRLTQRLGRSGSRLEMIDELARPAEHASNDAYGARHRISGPKATTARGSSLAVASAAPAHARHGHAVISQPLSRSASTLHAPPRARLSDAADLDVQCVLHSMTVIEDLVEQFEHAQDRLPTGSAVSARRRAWAVDLHAASGPSSVWTDISASSCVTAGEYFFLPSLSALAQLSLSDTGASRHSEDVRAASTL